MTGPPEPLLWPLFVKLRECGFPLAPDDFEALLLALRAGFGWSSPAALCALCCALWAKSREERQTLEDLFKQLGGSEWSWNLDEATGAVPDLSPDPGPIAASGHDAVPPAPTPQHPPALERPPDQGAGRPLPSPGDLPLARQHPLVFQPRYPVGHREIVQALRRLRRPIRSGPATELDIDATVARRCRIGIASPAVLVPRRRNEARLLVLVDRQGSMTPFHPFIEEFCAALQQAARFDSATVYYFHDVPAEGADGAVLDAVEDRAFPVLDAVLHRIEPLAEGTVFDDPLLLSPRPLGDVLAAHAEGAGVLLVGDAGAARGRYDVLRLLDTVAFLKALRLRTSRYVLLNPCPMSRWAPSTAGQVARHAPMLPLDRRGLERAVETLRGRPIDVERPV